MTATATAPQLTIDGHTAVITGVRYQHRSGCVWCRNTVVLTSEAGRVDAGIQVSGSGKTVRWYLNHNVRPVQVPERCPLCDHDRWSPVVQGGSVFNIPSRVSPSTQQGYLALLNEVWTTIRAEYPHLVTEADQRTSTNRTTIR